MQQSKRAAQLFAEADDEEEGGGTVGTDSAGVDSEKSAEAIVEGFPVVGSIAAVAQGTFG